MKHKKKKNRKKRANPEIWKKNKNRLKRLRGEEYISSSKKYFKKSQNLSIVLNAGVYYIIKKIVSIVIF